MLDTLSLTVKEDLRDKLLEIFPQGLCVLDQQYRLLYINEQMSKLTGWDQKVIGQSLFKLLPVKDREYFLSTMETLMLDRLDKISFVYDPGDMVSTFSRWQVDIHTAHSHLLLIINDLTEAYDLKNKVVYISTELEFLQHLSDPLIIFNQNKQIKYANRAFQAFFDEGFQLEQTCFSALLKPHEFCDFKDVKLKDDELPLARVLRGEEVHNQEVQVINRNGKPPGYYYVCAKPLPIVEEGELRHYILWMKEVSFHVQEARVSKDFIQTAAHELRTPMTSIKGFIQLIHERYNERKQNWYFKPTLELIQDLERDHTFFEIILDQMQRLDELTSELLSINKIAQGKLEINVESVDFNQLLEEVIDECQQIEVFHKIHYQNDSLPRFLYIDRKQIKRVIHNFLSNAIKYSPASEDIYIEIKEEEEQLIFSVRDEGLGIPEESKQRIFERFFRVHHPDYEELPGNGIGLHICREIINLHGGNIWFTSEYGVGSTFYFSLPLHSYVDTNNFRENQKRSLP